jgi:acyl carrier protein
MNAQTATPKNEFEEELAKLVVTALNLDINPAEINPDAPLYGDEGLGIDSIDILEISLALSKQYGVQLRADDENSKQIFASLRNLGTHIQANRTK